MRSAPRPHDPVEQADRDRAAGIAWAPSAFARGRESSLDALVAAERAGRTA